MNLLKIHIYFQFDHFHYNRIEQKHYHQLQNEYHIQIEHYQFLDVPFEF